MSSRISRRADACEMPRFEGDTAARRLKKRLCGVFSLFAAYIRGSKLLHKAANSPSSRKPKCRQIECAGAEARLCLRESIITGNEQTLIKFKFTVCFFRLSRMVSATCGRSHLTSTILRSDRLRAFMQNWRCCAITQLSLCVVLLAREDYYSKRTTF